MKFEQTSVEGLKHAYRVTIPAALIEEKIKNYLASYGQNLKIAGFRQGKVPAQLVETRYGVSAQEQALADAMEEANSKLIKEQNIKLSSEAKIESISYKRGDDCVYNYIVEVFPDIKIKDFKDVDLVKFNVNVDEKEIEKRLALICKEHIQYAPLKSKRSAKVGDKVTVKMTTRVKNKPIEDFNSEALGIVIEADPEKFIFPEIISALIGGAEGQELTVNHTIPSRFKDRKLVGQKADTYLKILSIAEVKETKLDDTLATDLGWENLKAMREGVRTYIQNEYKTLSQMLLKRRILDALAGKYNFELPAGLVDEEFNTIWKRLQDELNLARTSGDLVEDEGDDEESLRKEYKSIAERRVRLGLVISEIGRANEVHLSEKEMMNILTREAMRYPGREREVMKYYQQHPNALSRLMAPSLEDKVVEFLASNANVKEKSIEWPAFKKEIRGVLPTALDDDEDEAMEKQSNAATNPAKESAKKASSDKKPTKKKAG